MSTTGRSPGSVVIEIVRALGDDCRERHQKIWEMRQRGETGSQFQTESDQLDNHPVHYGSARLEELTGINRDILLEIAMRIGTPNGLRAWKKHSQPLWMAKSHPDSEGFLEPDPPPSYSDLTHHLPVLKRVSLDEVREFVAGLRAYCDQHGFGFDGLGLGVLESELAAQDKAPTRRPSSGAARPSVDTATTAPGGKRLTLRKGAGGDTAELDGHSCRLKSVYAYPFLKALQAAQGDIIKGLSLEASIGSRRDKVFKTLPPEIQAIIEAPGRGSEGYRIL